MPIAMPAVLDRDTVKEIIRDFLYKEFYLTEYQMSNIFSEYDRLSFTRTGHERVLEFFNNIGKYSFRYVLPMGEDEPECIVPAHMFKEIVKLALQDKKIEAIKEFRQYAFTGDGKSLWSKRYGNNISLKTAKDFVEALYDRFWHIRITG